MRAGSRGSPTVFFLVSTALVVAAVACQRHRPAKEPGADAEPPPGTVPYEGPDGGLGAPTGPTGPDADPVVKPEPSDIKL